MAEFTPYFYDFKRLDYRNFVILRFHGISKRHICKMYKIAYFCILDVCKKRKIMTINLLIRIMCF